MLEQMFEVTSTVSSIIVAESRESVVG